MKFLAALTLIARINANAAPDWASREWDVIVVGAGTAGIVVADRLSEGGLNTLLLERGGASYGVTGGRERPEWLEGTELSRVDVPDKSIFAGNTNLTCDASVVNAFQACTVGGNSAINAGLYFQPPASDWDDYHPVGWKSKDMQPAIERLLARQPAVTKYSTDGRFYLQSGYRAAKDWLVGAAGFSDVAVNGKADRKENVFGRPVYNYIGGQRGGPVRTYLQSAQARDGRRFHLQTGAVVEYILQKRGTASGVVVVVDGKRTTVRVSPGGRVILSAGAILSPKILMYSGIGPKDALTNLSEASYTPYHDASSWVVNPAVGRGLFDNPNTFIELSSPSIESYVQEYDNPIPKDGNLFLQSRSGPYTFASQTSVFWTYVAHDDGSRTGVQGTIDSSGHGEFVGNDTITLNIYGTSGMLSSGRVLLSADGGFVAGPSSDVYYSHERDSRSIATFIHTIFQALPPSSPKTPARQGLTPLNLAQNSTLDEIHKYITTKSDYAVGEVQHWSSSCRLGSCVDDNTKVVGTRNIHVIDASIVSPLTVNPQFGVMAAAERGAERVLRVANGNKL